MRIEHTQVEEIPVTELDLVPSQLSIPAAQPDCPWPVDPRLWAPVVEVVYNGVMMTYKDSELGAHTIGDHRIHFGLKYTCRLIPYPFFWLLYVGLRILQP